MPVPLPPSGESDRTLDAIPARCQARARALTPLRRAVLGLLLAVERPIGAYALLERLRAIHPQAAPPTVYRALTFLVGEGLVHRIERLNAFIAAGNPRTGPGPAHVAGGSQFLICDRCGHTAQLHDPVVVEALAGITQRFGFVTRAATIEMQGICAACSNAGTPGGGTACPSG